MGKPINLYDVWTDGSYNNTHCVGGAGWLIRHEGEEDREGYKSISHFDKAAKPHGSDIAEIFAVSHALRQLPHGAVVKLRLDCQNVIDWLNKGEITTKSKRDVFMVRNVFRGAMDAIGERSVEFIKVGGKGNSNPDLARVNELARTGSHRARQAAKPKR